ncbi:hypothetical protein M2368_001418 [Arthrobacter sp. JUb119]|nr:hypothetical protein [Arthrobacter sp. JUb119]
MATNKNTGIKPTSITELSISANCPYCNNEHSYGAYKFSEWPPDKGWTRRVPCLDVMPELRRYGYRNYYTITN